MATQTVLTEHTVSITELRKHPAQYFKESPVAVLSNNKTAGYLISAELFERMIGLLEQQQAGHAITAQFRPTANRLSAIVTRGGQCLLDATDEQLSEFTE
jgi:antitoxin YafN